jgi:hypothetical protein
MPWPGCGSIHGEAEASQGLRTEGTLRRPWRQRRDGPTPKQELNQQNLTLQTIKAFVFQGKAKGVSSGRNENWPTSKSICDSEYLQ